MRRHLVVLVLLAFSLVGVAGAATVAPTFSIDQVAGDSFRVTIQNGCGHNYRIQLQSQNSNGTWSNAGVKTQATSACALPPPPPPPPPAPPSGLFLAPAGSDANPCSQAQPCLSFNRAYRLANCGDAVEVAAGSYASQDILDDPAKVGCASNVLIHPASGASVSLGSLSLSGADHLTVQGFTAHNEVDITNGANSSTVDQVNTIGGFLYVASPTSNVVVSNSSFGNTNRVTSKVWLGSGGQNVNLLLDGDNFHDTLSDDLNCCHVEGLLVIHENGLTIRNSTFTDNAVFDLSAGECCGSDLAGAITLEGNHFNSVRSGVSDYTVASLNFNTNTSVFPAFTVRSNSFARGESGTPAPGTYCGNTGSTPASWQQPC